MDLFELTRKLIDIESITLDEREAGEFLFAHLSEMAVRHQGCVERMDVEPGRFNVFAHWGDPAPVREAVARAAGGRVSAREVLCIPAVRLDALEGFETTVVAYTSDIPAFGGAWGRPYLIGPSSIQVAHTLEERVAKKQLAGAVEIYQRMVRQILNTQ